MHFTAQCSKETSTRCRKRDVLRCLGKFRFKGKEQRKNIVQRKTSLPENVFFTFFFPVSRASATCLLLVGRSVSTRRCVRRSGTYSVASTSDAGHICITCAAGGSSASSCSDLPSCPSGGGWGLAKFVAESGFVTDPLSLLKRGEGAGGRLQVATACCLLRKVSLLIARSDAKHPPPIAKILSFPLCLPDLTEPAGLFSLVSSRVFSRLLQGRNRGHCDPPQGNNKPLFVPAVEARWLSTPHLPTLPLGTTALKYTQATTSPLLSSRGRALTRTTNSWLGFGTMTLR